jgi:hypothetical protein
MKWLLLLTILSGYSGSSTATASFDSKEACESAGKSHDEAIRQLHWHSFALFGRAVRLQTHDRDSRRLSAKNLGTRDQPPSGGPLWVKASCRDALVGEVTTSR